MLRRLLAGALILPTIGATAPRPGVARCRSEATQAAGPRRWLVAGPDLSIGVGGEVGPIFRRANRLATQPACWLANNRAMFAGLGRVGLAVDPLACRLEPESAACLVGYPLSFLFRVPQLVSIAVAGWLQLLRVPLEPAASH